MIDFNTWRECGELPDHLPPKPLEKNKLGGFDPETKEQIKKFKKADLITLGKDTPGTNCGNCSFVRKKESVGFCTHKNIMDWVTDRNCCIHWTNDSARRSWEKNSDET